MAAPARTNGRPKAPKVDAPSCKECKRALATGAKIVIDGWYWCPDCVYKREHPNASDYAKPPRSVPIQSETLFPLPSATPTRPRD